MKKHTAVLGLLLIVGLILCGCARMTPAQRGAVGGGAVGALGGQLIGGDTDSTLIGAGVGALGGALLNDELQHRRRSPGRRESDDR